MALETENGKTKARQVTPEWSLLIWNHSPTGFEFGYGGSGPSQLALAILLDLTHDPAVARAYHQKFKWKFIAPMGHPGDEIEAETINDWLEKEKENET